MLLLSFHIMPHALLILHLRAVHGYTLLFYSATTMRLSHVPLPFHFMTMLDACFYFMPLDTRIF